MMIDLLFHSFIHREATSSWWRLDSATSCSCYSSWPATSSSIPAYTQGQCPFDGDCFCWLCQLWWLSLSPVVSPDNSIKRTSHHTCASYIKYEEALISVPWAARCGTSSTLSSSACPGTFFLVGFLLSGDLVGHVVSRREWCLRICQYFEEQETIILKKPSQGYCQIHDEVSGRLTTPYLILL